MRPLLAVVSMVKNEASSVRAMLESTRAHVGAWLVWDTGSTDGTREIAKEVMGGIPGNLVVDLEPTAHHLKALDRNVFDYAANRNRALDFADLNTNKQHELPVFTLFIGGDETLHVEGDRLRAFLEEHRNEPDGAYGVRVVSGTRAFAYTRVLRVGGGWRYAGIGGVGAIHESPFGPKGEFQAKVIPGVTIVHAPTDVERKMQRIREHDLPVLEEAVADESQPLEARASAILYLAETHALLAADCRSRNEGKIKPGGEWLTHQMTAMSLYWRYAQIAEQPEWAAYDPARTHYALAVYFDLAGNVPGLYLPVELLPRLDVLVQTAPKLPEARFLLAKYATFVAQADPKNANKMKIALGYAYEAAKVARAARLELSYELSETTLEWRSLVMASACANHLRQILPAKEDQIKKMSQARKLLEAAIAAGAPPELAEQVKEAEAVS